MGILCSSKQYPVTLFSLFIPVPICPLKGRAKYKKIHVSCSTLSVSFVKSNITISPGKVCEYREEDTQAVQDLGEDLAVVMLSVLKTNPQVW